jgi:alpha-glucosidase
MIITTDYGFIIRHQGTTFIEHTTDRPAIFVGTKNIDISMDKGEFHIKDQTSYIPARPIDISDDSIHFGQFSIQLTIIENRLILTFVGCTVPVKLRIQASKEESIFGLGEHFTAFNLRGHRIKNWVEEHITRPQIYNKIIRRLLKLPPKKWHFEDYKTYMVVPSFISSNKYFCDIDTDGYGTFDFTNDKYHEISFVSPIKTMTLSTSSSLLETSADLCRFKGITPPLPEWIYDGMILGIQGGTTTIQKELDALLENNTHICAIWAQDWCGELFTYFGKQVLWNWTVDTTLYPNLQDTIQQWNQNKIRFLGYVNPYLNQNEAFFQEANDLQYLVKNKDGSPFLTQATSFKFGIVDLTNVKAYKWFKQLIKREMLDLGMSGWMADFGEYLPTECVLHDGSGEELHNLWPDLWTKLNRELIEETQSLGDKVFFNRAGYKNNMAYTTLIWNGDQHVDFTNDFGMRSAVRAMLGLSMSGFGLSHSDIGGYTTVPGIKRSKTLYMRWLEMNAFTPVMRGHEGNRPWSNVQPYTDSETIQQTARFSRIHSLLKPYFKAVEQEYQQRGYPMIRPLCFYANEHRDDCFMVGSDLIVYPTMHTRKTTLSVLLPAGEWTHAFSSTSYQEGTHRIDAPLGAPAVFYRSNSVYHEIFQELSK